MFGKNIKFIQYFHRLFSESAIFYSSFMLIQFVCFMIYLAASAFQMDLVIKLQLFRLFQIFNHWFVFLICKKQFQSDNFGFIMSCIMFSAGLSVIFIYCVFGKLATESLLSMSDRLYESNWCELPVDFQKHFILMIQNTQKPLFYHGFGVAVLNLETFTKASKMGKTKTN